MSFPSFCPRPSPPGLPFRFVIGRHLAFNGSVVRMCVHSPVQPIKRMDTEDAALQKKYYASSFGIGSTPQSKSQRLSYGLNELLKPISHSRSGVQQLDWAPCARVFMRPVNLSPPQWKKSVCDEFIVTIGLCQLAKRNPFRFICTKSGASVC